MKQNYCLIKKNKIYAEIFDELLEEELSMNKIEDNSKIQRYFEKKIMDIDYINISEIFTDRDEILSDLILKITSEVSNKNLQGNTVSVYADDDFMYELFHMEDLTKTRILSDDDLNEFGSISNTHLLPIYWSCGIFKTVYKDGKLYGDLINKSDILKILTQNYYHTGVIVSADGKIQEIEFTGENPFKVIGTNFVQSNQTEILGFNLLPFIENCSDSTDINILASSILGREIKGRVFISLLCPTTNKKYWSIYSSTINNILKIGKDQEKAKKIYGELDADDKYINPFYLLKKYL